jgi:hypothetical protein
VDDLDGLLPEERGDLEPPNRWPPTAIGVATPPPPRRRSTALSQKGLLRPLYITATGLSLGGLAALLLAPWLILRAAGFGALVAGVISLALIVWVDSGGAARVALWRRTRWLRRRQRALTRSSRPSA